MVYIILLFFTQIPPEWPQFPLNGNYQLSREDNRETLLRWIIGPEDGPVYQLQGCRTNTQTKYGLVLNYIHCNNPMRVWYQLHEQTIIKYFVKLNIIDWKPVGDLTGNKIIDLDDLLCIISYFTHKDIPPYCSKIDPYPCFKGDNVWDLDDILITLASFKNNLPKECK